MHLNALGIAWPLRPSSLSSPPSSYKIQPSSVPLKVDIENEIMHTSYPRNTETLDH